MTLAIERQIVLALALCLASAGPATAQSIAICASTNCPITPDQVQASAEVSRLERDFATAVRRFVATLAGLGGDGNAIRSRIESISAALVRWDEAIHTLETALPPTARSAEMHVALGTVYLSRHRLNDALREFGEAVRLDPRRADGHTRMATAYDLADQPSDAALALLTSSALEPDNPSTFYELARLRTRMGQAQETQTALRLFRESVQKQLAVPRTRDAASAPFERAGPQWQTARERPFFPPALYSSGFALLTQGAYAEAIVRFRQAAALDPLSADFPQAADRLQQGRSALQQENLQSALGHLKSAVTLDPDRAEPHRILGMAYSADGQYDHSIEQFNAALRANPADERSSIALADVLATIGQFAQAEQVLKNALQVIPGSGQAHYDLGRLYQSLARYPDAVRQLEEAATLNPVVGLDSLYEMIGTIYVGQADFDHAADAYAKRIDVNPNSADAHRKLGDVHLRQDRYDDALAEFMATLLVDPRSSYAYSGMAQVHLRTGRYAEAAEASRRALELDPTIQEARYARGTALMRLGQVEESAKQMDQFQRLQAEAMASARRQYELDRIKRAAAVSLANSEYEKAAGLLRQALPYESSVASTYLALGFALLASGHHSEAVVYLQTASQLEPGADVHRYLAEAYTALGRLEESRSESDLYEQALERMKKERLRKMAGSP